MINNMLKAVFNMLADSKEPKVACARDVLSELIKATEERIKPESAIMEDTISMLGQGPMGSFNDPEAEAAAKELLEE